MFGGGFCSVGCQERDADDKLGSRAEWGLSKLRCITSDEERQTGQNNLWWQDFLVFALTLNGEMTLKPKQCFCVILHCLSDLLFYLQLLVIMKANDAAPTWGISVCKQLYHVCSSSILSPSYFSTNHTHTQLYNPVSLVCFLYSRGSDGDLVVRSDKVQLQCINWVDVRPQNGLCLQVLAAAQGVHSSHSLSGPPLALYILKYVGLTPF